MNARSFDLILTFFYVEASSMLLKIYNNNAYSFVL